MTSFTAAVCRLWTVKEQIARLRAVMHFWQSNMSDGEHLQCPWSTLASVLENLRGVGGKESGEHVDTIYDRGIGSQPFHVALQNLSLDAAGDQIVVRGLKGECGALEVNMMYRRYAESIECMECTR